MKLTHSLLTSVFIAALSMPGMAQSIGQCSAPIYTQSFIDDVQGYWSADRTYVADSFDTASAERGERVRISGDIIVVNEVNFASLTRSAGQSITGMEEIVFDGRKILIDMPVRLFDASVSFFAEEVIFGPQGSISIQSPPRSNHQVVEIVARRLDLSNARPLPFNFATRDWAVPMTTSIWPEEGGPERILRINVHTLVPERAASNLDIELLEKSPERFFFRRTLDRTSGAGISGGAIFGADDAEGDEPVWSRAFQVTLGKGTEYAKLLSEELLWPSRTSEKIERIFVRAPYDPEVADFIMSWLDKLQPYFLEHDLVPAGSKLQNIRVKLTQGLDQLGLTSFDVPMTDFQDLVDEFKGDIRVLFGQNNSGGLLKAWDEQLVDSLDTGMIDANLVKEAKSRLTQLEVREKALSRSIDAVVSELDAITIGIVEETERSAEIAADLREDWERHQQDLRDLNRAVEGVKFVGVAASVVFPASAPIILGASQALASAGSGAMAHNSGEEIDFAKLAELAQQGVTEYNERKKTVETLGKTWASAKEGWSRVTDSFDPAWDEVTEGELTGENVEKWIKGASDVYKNLDKFIEELRPPTERQTVQIPEFAASDGRMREIMISLAALKGEESALKADVAILVSDLQGVQSQLLSQATLVNDLQTLDLRNDVDLMRLRQMSVDLRRDLLFSVAQSASLILRGSVYHTGRWIDIDAGILTFAGDQLTRLADELNVTDPDVLREELADWRSEAWRNYSTLAFAAEDALKEWSTAQGGATPTVYTYTADLTNLSLSPYWSEGRDFLTAVNRVLRDIHGAADSETRVALTRHPIRIPWYRISPPNFAGPEFLLGAVITRVEFDPPIDTASGRQVLLFVRHPRHGEVFYSTDGETCFVAQDFAANGETYTFSASAPVDDRTPGSELERLQTINVFTELQNRSYPLRSPYYLTVSLPEPGAWETLPTITKMNISFVGLRKQ